MAIIYNKIIPPLFAILHWANLNSLKFVACEIKLVIKKNFLLAKLFLLIINDSNFLLLSISFKRLKKPVTKNNI